jgi:hypothetical protein
VKNPMGKPLPLTLLGVINPCHLHDPNGMSQPDDITNILSRHGGSLYHTLSAHLIEIVATSGGRNTIGIQYIFQYFGFFGYFTEYNTAGGIPIPYSMEYRIL